MLGLKLNHVSKSGQWWWCLAPYVNRLVVAMLFDCGQDSLEIVIRSLLYFKTRFRQIWHFCTMGCIVYATTLYKCPQMGSRACIIYIISLMKYENHYRLLICVPNSIICIMTGLGYLSFRGTTKWFSCKFYNNRTVESGYMILQKLDAASLYSTFYEMRVKSGTLALLP